MGKIIKTDASSVTIYSVYRSSRKAFPVSRSIANSFLPATLANFGGYDIPSREERNDKEQIAVSADNTAAYIVPRMDWQTA